MFAKLRAWLQARDARRSRERYEAGFSWAMIEYELNQRPLHIIEAIVDEGSAAGMGTEFDKGALRAIHIIRNGFTQNWSRYDELTF